MRWLKGNREVVAPISAPMLHMVAIPEAGQSVSINKIHNRDRTI